MTLRRRPLLLSLGLAGVQAKPRPLVYARQGDPLKDFCFVLLREALARAGSPLQLTPSRERVSHARALADLAAPQSSHSGIELIWTMTNQERERELLPIRIPLDRGLFGWRVLFVRAGEEARFAGARRLADLRSFSFLQGHDWPDADILAANGLRVERATQLEALFPMVARQRADALPRGVPEVEEELASRATPQGLVLEPRLLLRYPTALYCFVSPQRRELAAELERCLRALQASGAFDRLLRQWFAPSLALVKLPQRRVIELRNPFLPVATPLQDASLWWK